MEPLFRWGLLGPGAVAERFAQSLQAVNDAELAAVASRSLDRAQVFAKRFGSARAYDSYQALYEDAGIDAVYICTPHRFHYEQTKACLLAGKPVLCEKPLAINAQQGRELFALAHEQGVFLMEAMWTPLLPVYQQLKAWLIEGRIGNIVKLQSSFGFTIDRDPEYRLLNHNLAGGVLLDMGVYNVALSQWLINSERECITADGFIGETGVDEKISATINYSGGVCSQFQCSFLTQLTNDFFIIGSKGRIRLEPYFWEGRAAVLESNDETERCEIPHRGRGFEYEIEHAMRCMAAEQLESPEIGSQHTLAVLAIMDEIRDLIGMRYDFE